jgi:uncharacterized LabA/DUF88 family protein
MPRRPDQLRVVVFVDGQNLYHACRRHFGHGYCHPHLLALELAQGRELVEVRFYTGVHDPRVHPLAHAVVSRRLEAMRQNGVWTYTHPLKYSEEEAVDHAVPACDHGFWKVDTLRKGREKGIDLRIGLDMLRLARQGAYDVAVLVSQDTDLNQAVEELLLLRDELDRWLAVENAVPYSPASGRPLFRLMSCRRWHVIDGAMFGGVRDDTDYTKPSAA